MDFMGMLPQKGMQLSVLMTMTDCLLKKEKDYMKDLSKKKIKNLETIMKKRAMILTEWDFDIFMMRYGRKIVDNELEDVTDIVNEDVRKILEELKTMPREKREKEINYYRDRVLSEMQLTNNLHFNKLSVLLIKLFLKKGEYPIAIELLNGMTEIKKAKYAKKIDSVFHKEK